MQVTVYVLGFRAPVEKVGSRLQLHSSKVEFRVIFKSSGVWGRESNLGFWVKGFENRVRLP